MATNTNMTFQRAVKTSARLRMLLAGPSGSGKTMTALLLAAELAGPSGRVAFIDTERGSAAKYADLFRFDVLELESFHPDRYVEAIQAAESAGYDVLVIDSLTHEWRGTDGVLQQIDLICRRDHCTSIQAWAKATPLHQRFLDAMMGSRCHIIGTVRSKMGVAVDKDEKGKTTVAKIGMESEQRDGIEYEFDVAGDLDREHVLVISKSRCPALTDAVIRTPGRELAQTLARWLSGAPSTPGSTSRAQEQAREQETWTATPAGAREAPMLTPEPTPSPTPAPTPEPTSTPEQRQAAQEERARKALTHERIHAALLKMGRREEADQVLELVSVFDYLAQEGDAATPQAILKALGARIADATALSTPGATAQSLPHSLEGLPVRGA